MTTSRTRRLALALAGVAVAATAVSIASPAVAVPRADAGNPYGIPPLTPTSSTVAEEFAGSTTVTLPRLHATAQVPDTTFLGYLRTCVEFGQSGSSGPDCPDIHPPTTSFDAPDGGYTPVWLQITGPVWAVSPAGAALPYGTFPTAHATGTQGGVAVSADVTVSQPRRSDGTVAPFTTNVLVDENYLPSAGGTVTAHGPYPAVTIRPNDGDLYLIELASLTGSVDVHVGNVRVAGRPVDVGGSCRTAQAATVALSSPSGTYRFDESASSLHGRPGGFQPFSSDPGSLQGAVSIPAFTGCRSGGVDVSPLVTALVSGRRNAVDLNLTQGFTDCATDSNPRPCPAFPTADGIRTSSTKSSTGFIR